MRGLAAIRVVETFYFLLGSIRVAETSLFLLGSIRVALASFFLLGFPFLGRRLDLVLVTLAADSVVDTKDLELYFLGESTGKV